MPVSLTSELVQDIKWCKSNGPYQILNGEENMVGKPKYKCGDIVQFKFYDGIKEGVIAIVDKYGTFEDNSDVSYDILVEGENTLYKHFTEKSIVQKTGETDAPW